MAEVEVWFPEGDGGAVSGWWRIESKGDHYAVIVNGMLYGTIERASERWGWYPVNFGTRLEYVDLRLAIERAKQDAEKACSI